MKANTARIHEDAIHTSTRALLIALWQHEKDAKGRTKQEVCKTEAAAKNMLEELRGLVGSLGWLISEERTVHLRDASASHLLGKGKVQEIIDLAKTSQSDAIVFDDQITPMQQRNWEADSGLEVVDRNEIILRIFAARAQSKEARLQVELARLRYTLPRLARSYTGLSRQRGGRFGTKGYGEQKLELDRRKLEKRIHDLQEEIISMTKARTVQRSQRERQQYLRAAIVGYTNSGKSSLINALTGSTLIAEDKLFATLDPSTKRLDLGSQTILITDTVGFIRKLPHGLIDAFKSTLEETLLADFLIKVVDVYNAEALIHLKTTEKVLEEIGAADLPCLIVLNKVDLLEDGDEDLRLFNVLSAYPKALPISAKSGHGLEKLVQELVIILERISKETVLPETFYIPDNAYYLIPLLYKKGKILSEERQQDYTILKAIIPDTLKKKMNPYKEVPTVE